MCVCVHVCVCVRVCMRACIIMCDKSLPSLEEEQPFSCFVVVVVIVLVVVDLPAQSSCDDVIDKLIFYFKMLSVLCMK